MSRRACLAIVCDADPDTHPGARRASADTANANWQGIAIGIGALRRRLAGSSYVARHGQPPMTWLLRSDRQIAELYGHAAFCFRAFAHIWADEQRHGSEIGWHPHLYRWDDRGGRWAPYLGEDDDPEVLERCLAALRECADIRVVRTGWCYHSNALMELFDCLALHVDASAIPGSVERHNWHHDWTGTGRRPFRPSRRDYRTAGTNADDSLNLQELPVIVRRLAPSQHAIRYGVRAVRAVRSDLARWPAWEGSRWQGVTITRHRGPFVEALRQTLAACSRDEDVFIGTYFHTGELLADQYREAFAQNLERLSDIVQDAGLSLEPTTLTGAWRVLGEPSGGRVA